MENVAALCGAYYPDAAFMSSLVADERQREARLALERVRAEAPPPGFVHMASTLLQLPDE